MKILNLYACLGGKQETLEEAAEKYAKYNFDSSHLDIDDHFIAGAKWQQERMYSEEEVIDILKTLRHHSEIGNDIENIELWFEQFKKTQL